MKPPLIASLICPGNAHRFADGIGWFGVHVRFCKGQDLENRSHWILSC